MQERLEKVETNVGEFRTRFDAIDRRFDEFEQRLNTKVDVQVEHFESLVKTTAENFGGVLAGIARELQEFRAEMQEQSRLTHRVLGDHQRRISALERRRRQ